jgi:hypothetical protein
MDITIRKALTSTVNFPIPVERVEKALIDSGLDGDTIYAKADEKAVDLAMAGLLQTLITSGTVKEGGFTREMPAAAVLRSLRNDLLHKWGIDESLPVKVPAIYDGSDLW